MSDETTIQKLKGRIRAYIAREGISKREMARRAGVSEVVVRGVDKPHWNPTSDNLDRIDKAMRGRPLAGAANQSRLSA